MDATRLKQRFELFMGGVMFICGAMFVVPFAKYMDKWVETWWNDLEPAFALRLEYVNVIGIGYRIWLLAIQVSFLCYVVYILCLQCVHFIKSPPLHNRALVIGLFLFTTMYTTYLVIELLTLILDVYDSYEGKECAK